MYNSLSLKFSIRANWIPLYINNKLIAGYIFPLHRMNKKTFDAIDERGQETLKNYYYNEYAYHCTDPEMKNLHPIDFLRENRSVSHAILITFNNTFLLAGYCVFQHKLIKTHPPKGVHIDYFSSSLLNYPGNFKPKYLGNFEPNLTYYRVRGIGRATIALASYYAAELSPDFSDNDIAISLFARTDERLINDLYIKNYNFELYKGQRGKDHEMFLTFKKSKKFLSDYEKDYQKLDRPEGNGLTYKKIVR